MGELSRNPAVLNTPENMVERHPTSLRRATYSPDRKDTSAGFGWWSKIEASLLYSALLYGLEGLSLKKKD